MQMTNGRHAGVQTGATKLPAGRCAVSVLGTMTRVELEERVDVGLLRDGFLGRFALIPHNGRTKYMHRPPKWTPAMVEQRDHLVTWLRGVANSRDAFGDVFDLLTEDADATRAEWYDRRARELDRTAEDDPSEIAFAAVEAFSRLQTTALKVALVAAVAEQWPQPVTISPEHILYGIEFAELCLEEIVDLAKSGGAAREDRYAQKVVEYLAHGDSVTRTRLLDDVKHKALSREQRWKVVEALDSEGQVEIETFTTTGRPRQEVRKTPFPPFSEGVVSPMFAGNVTSNNHHIHSPHVGDSTPKEKPEKGQSRSKRSAARSPASPPTPATRSGRHQSRGSSKAATNG